MAVTYEPIATTTVSGGSTTTITLSSIPQTYTDLVMVWTNLLGNNTGATFYFNGTTGTGYDYVYTFAQNASVFTGEATNAGSINAVAGNLHEYNESWTNIFNYTSTSTNKSIISRFAGTGDASGDWSTRDVRSWYQVGTWRSTSAINSITLTSSSALSAGSTRLFLE